MKMRTLDRIERGSTVLLTFSRILEIVMRLLTHAW